LKPWQQKQKSWRARSFRLELANPVWEAVVLSWPLFVKVLRDRVSAPLRPHVSGAGRPRALHPPKAPRTERQSRTQPSDRRGRVLGTLRRPGLRRCQRSARRLGIPIQPRTLLDGAARAHADGETGRDAGSTARPGARSGQRLVSEHALLTCQGGPAQRTGLQQMAANYRSSILTGQNSVTVDRCRCATRDDSARARAPHISQPWHDLSSSRRHATSTVYAAVSDTTHAGKGQRPRVAGDGAPRWRPPARCWRAQGWCGRSAVPIRCRIFVAPCANA